MVVTLESLSPLSYHAEIRDYLKREERALWEWFASAQSQADGAEEVRLELLKTTYRLDPERHADLYAAAEDVKSRLGLSLPVTLYQSQSGTSPNACLCSLRGEAHLVFSGPILTLLNEAERRSILGHELSHQLLWQQGAGELFVADRILSACAYDPRSPAPHLQTARRFRLFTEVFADRGALVAVGDLEPVISSLVKVETGLADVSAGSYLRQAEEIFAASKVVTEGLSHPELFIRARALKLWADGRADADAQIQAMIEGPLSFEGADLRAQLRLQDITWKLWSQLLQPQMFRTDSLLAHARLFSSELRPAEILDDSLAVEVAASDEKVKEYVGYLLLDFACVDPELERAPLAFALEWGARLGIADLLEKLVSKELKLKGRELKKLKAQSAELLRGRESEPA